MKKINQSILDDLNNFREQLGSWKAVSQAVGVSTRTLRNIRNDPDQTKIKNKTYNKINTTVKKDLTSTDIPKSYPSHKSYSKYIIGSGKGGFATIEQDDYAYYDPRTEKHYAGQYSNKPTDQEISKTTYNRIRAGAKNQILKVNKAKQFLTQRGIQDPKQAYNRAVDWVQDYRQLKQAKETVAYQDKNNRWHLGSNEEIKHKGKTYTKGDFIPKELAKKLRGDITGKMDISQYLDRSYDISYIN